MEKDAGFLTLSGAGDNDGRNGGDGGNITIIAGAGGVPVGDGKPGKDGHILFQLADGTEMLRFDPDGSIAVRGEKVDSNEVIYEVFKSWLRACMQGARS